MSEEQPQHINCNDKKKVKGSMTRTHSKGEGWSQQTGRMQQFLIMRIIKIKYKINCFYSVRFKFSKE